MATTSAQVVETFEDIEANTPIVCDWTLFVKADIHVYYGFQRIEAVQNVDYTVTLGAAPNYASFTITPKTSLLTKINALIVDDPAEINYIEVRRISSVLTDSTPASARDSMYISREFDRVSLRLAETNEKLNRTFALPSGESGYNLLMPVWSPGKLLAWDATEKKLVNTTTNVFDNPTEQATQAAEAAEADRILTEAARDASIDARDQAINAANSFIDVPVGGAIGQVLTKSGAGDGETGWQDLPASFTTGMVMAFDATTAPNGWVVRNGGSIGSAASGATTRANADTEALFTRYWSFDPLDCPIQNSDGSASTRGANAAADYAANKRIVMPNSNGLFLRGLDNGRGVDVGRRIGSEQAEMIGPHPHSLTMDAVAAHSHGLTIAAGSYFGANNGGAKAAWSGGDSHNGTGVYNGGTAGAGGHTPTGVADNNTGTENRPRNSAVLICVKL